MCHICSAQWLLSVSWHLKQDLKRVEMQFVFCAASHITKKAGSLTLAVEQKEYNSFFCSLRVPAKWMHLNGEVAHSRAGGKGSETEVLCSWREKKVRVCSWLSLWNYHRMAWPLFSVLPTEISKLKLLKQSVVKCDGAETGKDKGIILVISVGLERSIKEYFVLLIL